MVYPPTYHTWIYISTQPSIYWLAHTRIDQTMQKQTWQQFWTGKRKTMLSEHRFLLEQAVESPFCSANFCCRHAFSNIIEAFSKSVHCAKQVVQALGKLTVHWLRWKTRVHRSAQCCKIDVTCSNVSQDQSSWFGCKAGHFPTTICQIYSSWQSERVLIETESLHSCSPCVFFFHFFIVLNSLIDCIQVIATKWMPVEDSLSVAS